MPLRICLIDDDIMVLEPTAEALRAAGHLVLTAPGAAAGLDLIHRSGADIIITDMNMPGTTGAQLISEARATWPDAPIIAISGSIDANGESMLDVARTLGANALLPKPFRMAQLHQVMADVLAHSREGGSAER